MSTLLNDRPLKDINEWNMALFPEAVRRESMNENYMTAQELGFLRASRTLSDLLKTR